MIMTTMDTIAIPGPVHCCYCASDPAYMYPVLRQLFTHIIQHAIDYPIPGENVMLGKIDGDKDLS